MCSSYTNIIKKNYKKNTLIENYKKILITMQPVIPHFSNECLELINIKDVEWPEYDANLIKEEKINLVIQINGKKRALIETLPNKTLEEILELIKKDETIKKYLKDYKIKKNIYIKDKLINLII